MFAPAEDKVLDVDLDDLLGVGGCRHAQVRDQVADAIHLHDLRVEVIVLCHGNDPRRFETTSRLCRSLEPVTAMPGVHLTVSYQDGAAPAELTTLLSRSMPVLAEHPRLFDRNGTHLPQTGKTEHLLSCLATLTQRSGDPCRRFVVFLDNDYVIYDPVNVLALYAPWVLGFAADGHEPADPRFAGVTFAKGGGLRLVVDPELTKSAPDRTWTFIELLDASLVRAAPHAPTVSSQVDAEFVPTVSGLRDVLGPAGLSELEAALEQVTKHGGRSSRALSLWLASQRGHLVEHWLSRFSFLLHGDQGAPLSTWSAMELAPGYGLELSFLINALFRPGMHTGRIVNTLTLPHAHLPKPEADNFAMGVEMFTLLRHLLLGMTSRADLHREPVPPGAAGPWRHYAATKLGYKPVGLAWPEPKVPALYPALNQLEGS